MQRFHGRNLRKGRHSSPGQIYLVTTVTHQRRPVFSDFKAARSLVRVLMNESMRADTLCYVIMPDHLHWLTQLTEQGTLSNSVQRIKAASAKHITATSGIRPVWQRGFHDYALRKEDDLVDVARYVVANPLRSGLVNSLLRYPHWDAVWLLE